MKFTQKEKQILAEADKVHERAFAREKKRAIKVIMTCRKRLGHLPGIKTKKKWVCGAIFDCCSARGCCDRKPGHIGYHSQDVAFDGRTYFIPNPEEGHGEWWYVRKSELDEGRQRKQT